MERKIGEIFEYNGEWYQCVKEDMYDYCKGCASFENLRCTTLYGNRDCWLKATCKKLEKVGEPYVSYRKLRQRYKLFIPLTLTNGILDEDISCDEVLNIIDIAIKQNQEDMEEKKIRLRQEEIDFLRRKFKEITQDYVIQGCDREKIQYEFGMLFESTQGPYNEEKKMNLKPFDIEAARSGKPICTREGRKARIICFDTINKGNYPIIALVEDRGFESAWYYDKDGKSNIEECFDLMMLPEKRSGWVNVYYDNDASSHRGCRFIYDTKEQAVKEAGSAYITTVKIEWEE